MSKPKQIMVVTGSSHHPGTTEILADNFVRGADEAGHLVRRFDAGKHEDVRPLIVDADNRAIDYHDSLQAIIPDLISADVIALVTPMYYYGPTAQLKMVIDRFYEYNHRMKDKESVILSAAYDDVEKFRALDVYYETLTDYMRWRDRGRIYAGGAWLVSQLGDYPRQAYELGKSI